jgi:hypothetical protein
MVPADPISASASWVFLSYSWDNPAHKDWVLGFANRLRDDGVDAILDQTHLSLGGETPAFMERCVGESKNVLIICTEGYKDRFDHRRGGAGYEGHIITAELLADLGKTKFIPVLRQGEWTTAMPTALGGIYGADLRADDEAEYKKLVKHLHGVPLQPRPLGTRPSWVDEPVTTTPPAPAAAAPTVRPPTPALVLSLEYFEQRRRLPDSALVKKIWQGPHWRISARPATFRPARFANGAECARFVANASVRSVARWSEYPWFTNPHEEGADYIANEIELSDASITHLERWVLFQSAQFVQNMALDEMSLLGGRTHVLEILNTTTALYEFAGRMVDRQIITEPMDITFELNNVAGRRLTWPKDAFGLEDHIPRDAHCQDAKIIVDDVVAPDAMVNDRRARALAAALALYEQFGWHDPPKDDLAREQYRRFGQPVHI